MESESLLGPLFALNQAYQEVIKSKLEKLNQLLELNLKRQVNIV